MRVLVACSPWSGQTRGEGTGSIRREGSFPAPHPPAALLVSAHHTLPNHKPGQQVSEYIFRSCTKLGFDPKSSSCLTPKTQARHGFPECNPEPPPTHPACSRLLLLPPFSALFCFSPYALPAWSPGPGASPSVPPVMPLLSFQRLQAARRPLRHSSLGLLIPRKSAHTHLSRSSAQRSLYSSLIPHLKQ